MARSRKATKNTVQNVRVIDEYAGKDSAYVDRCISDLQNSHSQITVLCTGRFEVNTATAASTSYYSGLTARNTDDFNNMAVQFQTFRIRAFRFDVYDVNSLVAVNNIWSTFHDNLLTVPAYPFDQVVDAPDSQVLTPGFGKATFYWRAKGTSENDFQSTALTGQSPVVDYGGLRVALLASDAVSRKYQVVMKALVDFRGRQ